MAALLSALCVDDAAWASGEDSSPNGDAIKLGLLAAAQEENRAKITSFSLTFTEHISFSSQNSSGVEEQYERTTLHRQHTRGPKSWIDRQSKTEITGPNGTRTEQFDERVILAETSLAYWPVNNPVAYLYEFESPTKWSKKARSISCLSNPHNVQLYGFGDRELSLKQMHDKLLPDGFRVKVSDPKRNGNGDAYLISITEEQSPSVLEELLVDPARGYLSTHVKYIDNDKVYTEIKVTPSEVAPGIWFPKIWEEWHYRTEGDQAGAVFNHSKDEITSFVLNPILDDSQFSCAALDLPSRVVVLRTDPAGVFADMSVENGELVRHGIRDALKKLDSP